MVASPRYPRGEKHRATVMHKQVSFPTGMCLTTWANERPESFSSTKARRLRLPGLSIALSLEPGPGSEQEYRAM